MRLFLYVFRDYIKYVVTTLVLCLFLFVLFDFIHRTTNYFSTYKPSASLVAQMYLYQLPMFATQALPIAGLLSSVVTMVMLSRTNEISAMRAAGMGPIRISLPLAVGGLFLSLVSILSGEFLVPKSAAQLHHVQEVLIEGGSEHSLASSSRWQRKDQSIVHFKEYDYAGQSILGLEVVTLSSSFKPLRSVYAESAKYSPTSKVWDAQNVLITFFGATGTIDHTDRRATLTIPLSIDPKRLTRDRRLPEELSSKELKQLIIKGEKSGADTLAYRVDLQVKLAYPLAAFVVSLIGLSFAYRSERTTETAKSILLAFGIGISYWFVLNWVKALGKRGDIPPIVAGWFANVFILAIVVFQSWKGRKEA
jgi:lipopolysaccharide export system permease protein